MARRRHAIFEGAIVFALMVTSLAQCQQLSDRMSNKDVVDMVALGLSDDLIIDKINSIHRTEFDTSITGLKALKAARVSDSVIRAMINSKSVTLSDSTAPVSPTVDGAELPVELGVYLRVEGKLTELEPEIVGWQTGGVLKHELTLGLNKGHVNGKIMKQNSPVQVSTPVEFVIKTAEGTSVTEYQLLRLYEKGNRREFRATTGGIIHASAGAERNAVSFQPEKVATRTWRIRLTNLGRGEYGFLPPGLLAASISSNGKMYTFGVTEEDHAHPSSSRISRVPRTLTTMTEAQTGSSLMPSTDEGSIGAFSDENPRIRHDGIVLSRVVPGGPADRAGIQVNDVILAIDGHYIFTSEELSNEIRQHKPGTGIAVRYRRYRTIYDTHLTVESAALTRKKN